MSEETLKQIKHDDYVKTISGDHDRDNWQVKANVDVWETPSEKGNIIPDLECPIC